MKFSREFEISLNAAFGEFSSAILKVKIDEDLVKWCTQRWHKLEEDIERKLLEVENRRTNPVFKYSDRSVQNELKGEHIDRVAIHSKGIMGMEHFFNIIDLLRFHDPHVGYIEVIRFGYYSYRDGELTWASRQALSEPIDVIKTLFKKAYKTDWFKNLIDE